MKTYIIYVKGIEKGYLKAPNHIAAAKKAQKKYRDVKAILANTVIPNPNIVLRFLSLTTN